MTCTIYLNIITTFKIDNMYKKLILFFILVNLFFSCKDVHPPLGEHKIIITNLFNQDLSGTFYGSYETFTIPVNGSYTYNKTDEGGSFSFGDSDSVIIKFDDGKRKTDYRCGIPRINAIKPECWKDTVNLFNASRYLQTKIGEGKFVSYYYITQADYDEAK